ncbi:hypothetical protein GCM10028787_31400 [Brachybacterium horti]
MSLRSRLYLLGALAGAVIVGIVVAALISSALSGGGGPLGAATTPPTATTPSATTPPADAATPTEGGGTASSSDALEPGIQQDAADFLAAYTSDSDDQAWVEALTPVATPELLASLVTSDRDFARSLAGTTVGDPQSSTVPVLSGGDTIAKIHLVQIAEDDEGAITDASPWQVDYIDFTDPPEGTALPLSSISDREISAALQPVLATVLAQPGGLTDEARTAQIADAFTDPKEAVKIPRGAGSDKRITMGNVHDVQLATDENGNLTATVTVPWQIDGDPLAQWTTLTVTLSRDDAGSWTAVDATNS